MCIRDSTKATSWKYEQEVRAFLPSADHLAPDARCVELDWENIQGLIFGPKMSDADKTRAVVACHALKESRGPDETRDSIFLFLQARQEVDRFDFDLVPVGVLAGRYGRNLMPIAGISELDQNIASKVNAIAESIRASGR